MRGLLAALLLSWGLLPGQALLLNEIAILVRASYQMREFEDRFIAIGLPYRIIGGFRFYERQEIRDALVKGKA